MAYGEKFSLQFSDVYNNPRKLSILQKNYSGAVLPLIGTDDPVIIKWHNKDDVYNPIIGSTCEINLFVTETAGGTAWDELDENWNLSEVLWNETTGESGTNYDDWYDADEREYKVQISTGDISGSPLWDATDNQWQTSAVDWDDPTSQGFEFYWEGFIVNDSYREMFTSPPYPIKLIASDGLGTLAGFDAPYSNVVLSGSNPDTTSGSQSNFDGLFHYLVEILKNTDLDLDLYIGNLIRGSSGSANETLFHDIQAFEYGLLKNNFKRLNAKELLTKILQMTNSRIFQSQGRWYVISNSNLIDNRIIESQETAISTPIVQNINITTTENIAATIELNGFDADGLSLTFAITDDVDNGSTSLSGSTVTYTPTTDYVGQDVFYFTANNGTNTSAAAFVTITVVQAAATIPTGILPIAAPYNAWTARLFFGQTIEQSVSRLKGGSLNYGRTDKEYILSQIGEQPKYNSSRYNPLYDIAMSMGAGQSNSNFQSTWRWAQRGTKMVWMLVPQYIGGYGYYASNNNTDPEIGYFQNQFARTPDSANGVFSLQNGYYSFKQVPFLNKFNPSVNMDFIKNGYETALGQPIGSTIPRYTSTSSYPQDLKDVISNFGQDYIITVRIENDLVVERYQFASE